jgi:hypothetical protein
MLITQSGNFQIFEFESLAGIVSNTWRTKIGRNRFYCEDHCSRSSSACSHARWWRRGRAQLPLPRPEPWEREEKRKTAPGPPLSSPSPSLQAPDHHDLASTDPQHFAAETTPLQHASKAVEAGVARACRQHNLRRPPTGRPCPRRSGL